MIVILLVLFIFVVIISFIIIIVITIIIVIIIVIIIITVIAVLRGAGLARYGGRVRGGLPDRHLPEGPLRRQGGLAVELPASRHCCPGEDALGGEGGGWMDGGKGVGGSGR